MKDPSLDRIRVVLPAVVLVLIVGCGFVAFIEWNHPDKDNSSLITIIVGLLTPTLFSMLAYLKSEETHQLFNSRMTELMAKTDALARAEGIMEGKVQAQLERENKSD
jgi:hypothetical protein